MSFWRYFPNKSDCTFFSDIKVSLLLTKALYDLKIELFILSHSFLFYYFNIWFQVFIEYSHLAVDLLGLYSQVLTVQKPSRVLFYPQNIFSSIIPEKEPGKSEVWRRWNVTKWNEPKYNSKAEKRSWYGTLFHLV